MNGARLTFALGVGVLVGAAALVGCGSESRQSGGSAVYKCDKCGKTYAGPGSCCGAPTTKQAAEGSRRREGS